MSRIRVLLVDDNDDFLEGVRDWLTADERLQIVGTAHTAEQAIEQTAWLCPDVVLMDTTVPDMNGFEATRCLKTGPEPPLVVLMALHDSQTVRLEAAVAGADGFVSEAEVTERLIPVVEDLIRVRHGDGFIEGSGKVSGVARMANSADGSARPAATGVRVGGNSNGSKEKKDSEGFKKQDPPRGRP